MCNFDVTQTLQLRNNIEKPLYFRLATQPPFSVLKPQPQARTSSSSNPGDSQCLVLNPQHSMQVRRREAVTVLGDTCCRYRIDFDLREGLLSSWCDVCVFFSIDWQVNVAFHCSPSLLDHTDQADEEVMPGVTLIRSASGQRKLRFEQNLQIHYSNNSLQVRVNFWNKCGKKKNECCMIISRQQKHAHCLCSRCLSAPIWTLLRCVCPLTALTLGAAMWGRHWPLESTSTAMEPTHTGNPS